jgi:protein-disulfide isomerase
MKRALDLTATTALIVAASAITWNIFDTHRLPPSTASAAALSSNRGADRPLPTSPISIANAAVKGRPTAPLVLIEYSDFQCPYCGRFALEVLPTIEKQFVDTGKLVFALMPFPLPMHPNAEKAAEAAACAGLQGHFWSMHDQLFHHQQELDLEHLRSFAGDEGLDLRQFDTCIAGQSASTIRASVESGAGLGITGTPTFFVGVLQGQSNVKVVRRLVGAIPFQQVTKVIDDLLAARK